MQPGHVLTADAGQHLQLAAPELAPADLEEATMTAAATATGAIRARLAAAAQGEWATSALEAFDADPDRFLRLHFASVAEHGRTSVALMTAAAELLRRVPAAESIGQALEELGTTESDWLQSVGLALEVDRVGENSQ